MQRGFSLMELMFAVAVVGILAGIAYPSYQEQLRKTRRSEATSQMLQMAEELHKCFTINVDYRLDPNADGTPDCAVPNSRDTTHYTITVNPRTATAFTLTATPKPGSAQAGDSKCPSFILTGAGAKSPDSCW
jgi:type IV pilus assembly protein PilE